MKTGNRSCAVLASFSLAVVIACSSKEDGGKAKPPAGDKDEVAEPEDEVEPEAPPAPKYDEAELRKMLQGKWVTGAPDNPQATFVFDGDVGEVTTHKQIDSATNKPYVHRGKLEFSGANQLTIRTPNGSGMLYNFVKIDDRLHISAGDVYWVEKLEGFRVELDMGEILEFSATGCKWSVDFAGNKDARDVVCSIAEEDGKKVFKYQSPDPFDKTKLSDNTLLVAGNYLVSEQMVDEVATRIE